VCCAGETPPGEKWVKVVNVFGHLHARVIGGVRQHVGVVEKKTRSRESEIDRSIDFFSASSLAWIGHGLLLEIRLDNVTSVQESSRRDSAQTLVALTRTRLYRTRRLC